MKGFQLILCVFFALAFSCLGESSSDLKEPSEELHLGKRFREVLRNRFSKEDEGLPPILTDVFEEVLKLLAADMFPTAFSENVREQCRIDSRTYLMSHITAQLTFNPELLWALQMYESTGKYPEGLFGSGNLHAVGLFDECLAVRPPEPHNFVGRYCTVYIKPLNLSEERDEPTEMEKSFLPINPNARGSWINLIELIQLLLSNGEPMEPIVGESDPLIISQPSMGFCIPSSCDSSDLRTAVSEIVGSVRFGDSAIETITDNHQCFADTDTQPEFDGPAIAVIVILSVLAALVLTATAHEAIRFYMRNPIDEKNSSLSVKTLHCFSALNNGRKILSTKTIPGSFTCLHGIRVLSTTWVVMGHYWLMPFSWNISIFLLGEDLKPWHSLGLTNATVSVDTFFLISGFLVAYALMREFDRCRGSLDALKTVLLSYVHRYLRLTPVYGIILGFIATLMIYLGTGPRWYTVEVAAQGCREEAWTNFLYINNIVDPNPSVYCMGETWYLAVDMQLFLVSPLIIYPLWRWKWVGLIWLALLTLGSLAANFIVFAIYDFPAATIPNKPETFATDPNYMFVYYGAPHTRALPYLVGILLGWILHQNKKNEINLKISTQKKKLLACLCWALSIATGLAIVYGIYPYYDENTPITTAFNITYGSLNRFAWSIAVAWVIFACLHGYGGIVNSFLSWKIFIPLGRITYCIYLIHFNYYTFFFGHKRKPDYYTLYETIHGYLGQLLTVTLLSFFVSVTVEASFLNLEKLLFSPLTAKKSKGPVKLPDSKPTDSNSSDLNIISIETDADSRKKLGSSNND